MPIIAMLAAVLVWGASFIATKAAVAEFPPIAFALMRFTVATLALGVVIGATRTPWRVPRALRRDVLIAALLGTTLTYILENWALRFTTAGNCALFLAASPLLTVVGAVIFLREPLHWRMASGALLAFTGMFCLLGASMGATGVGDLLMALNVLVGAGYGLVSKKLADQMDPLVTLTATFGIGTLSLLPCAGVEWLWLRDSWHFTPTVGWALLYLGLGSSGGAYWLWLYALRRMSASEVGMFLYLMPVVTLVLSNWLLGESMGLLKAGEAALVLVGVYLANTGSQTLRAPASA